MGVLRTKRPLAAPATKISLDTVGAAFNAACNEVNAVIQSAPVVLLPAVET